VRLNEETNRLLDFFRTTEDIESTEEDIDFSKAQRLIISLCIKFLCVARSASVSSVVQLSLFAKRSE